MSDHASPRVPYTRLAAEAFKGLLATSKAVHDSSIDPTLMELLFLRVSQLNGCGYCMDMHGTALRKGASSRASSIPCPRGTKAASSMRASVPRWAGPRR